MADRRLFQLHPRCLPVRLGRRLRRAENGHQPAFSSTRLALAFECRVVVAVGGSFGRCRFVNVWPCRTWQPNAEMFLGRQRLRSRRHSSRRSRGRVLILSHHKHSEERIHDNIYAVCAREADNSLGGDP